jgi:hypothetical protein
MQKNCIDYLNLMENGGIICRTVVLLGYRKYFGKGKNTSKGT